MANYSDFLFAKEYQLDTERLEKQMEENERIRNFNKTIGTIFKLAAVATGTPWLAAGSSVVSALNPEKKYKTEYFREGDRRRLNRERRTNMPTWYDALFDVGSAYLASDAAQGLDLGGLNPIKSIDTKLSNMYFGT